ncbi:perlucin-like protein [Saccostrea cucullata]|uniref:perlucin-like protein n=1 Tax=Saccostrea cuccullata TaxID=36930 RepID=UPI002ED69293
MEVKILLIVVQFLLSLSTEVDCECSGGWISHGSSCYLFVHQNRHWTAAEDYCRNFHAYLTNIGDYFENQFLRTHVNLYGNGADFWVGATDAMVEGGWRWMPGFDPIGYDDWYPGQPNDDYNQDCMQLCHEFHYHWDDDHCEESKPFICEKSIPGEVIG